VVRGGVLAVLSALLTGVGHVAGGGSVPDLTGLVVLVPLLAAVFVSLADRCRGPVGTIATLGAGQFVLHQLMQMLHASHASQGGTSMIGMHAVVTLVTAAALLHADAAIEALVGALCKVVPRRLTPPPARRPLPTLAVAASDLPARIARQVFVAHARRGPPVGC
jgi:hypothetical protein